MKLFLGVDGGQTTTKTVVGDEQGGIVARASGGPSNHTEEPGGPQRLERVVLQTIQDALAPMGVSHPTAHRFAAACFGMTGETEIKTRILRRIVQAERISVVHDSVNALVGATAGEPGIIVIGGTGSVARGANAAGAEARVGGWGHQFGDEGSSYWIGREAVRATLAEYDRLAEATLLTPMLFERLEVNSPYQLTQKYYAGTLSRDHLAGLSVWVNEAATKGDRVAREILHRAGRDLAGLACSLIPLIFPRPDEDSAKSTTQKFPVCYAGGAFESEFVLASFRESVAAGDDRAEVRAAQLPPVLGSLLIAYRSAGIKIPAAVIRGWMI